MMDERDRVIFENNMKKAEEYVRLRDEFAKASMNGLISSLERGEPFNVKDGAEFAYRMADAMIEQRNLDPDT